MTAALVHPASEVRPVKNARVIRRFVSDHGEPQEEVACLLCGSAEHAPVFDSHDVLYDKPGTYRLVRCNDCSLAYVNPRPSFDALISHYPDDYFCYAAPEAQPGIFGAMAESNARRLTQRRLQRLERVIGRIPSNAEIVDVGCGLNQLLAMIRSERGAVGTGIDIKEQMVARIKDSLGMPAIHGTLTDAKLPEAKLDLVLMLEYLEHELNPGAMLAEARRVLKTGGHVAVEIPHPTGWPARFFKSRWANLDLPRHLVFFDERTLRRAFVDHGFELVDYRPFTHPLVFGINIVIYLGGRNLGRKPWAPLVMSALGLPFLPFTPWLPEFALAVGRAV